jgi:hypothetical protein
MYIKHPSKRSRKSKHTFYEARAGS